MTIDQDLLKRFEDGLDPQRLERSTVSAALVGFGEISAIFRLDDHPGLVYKRMPLFKDVPAARKYEAMYFEYCDLLRRAGLSVPETWTAVVQSEGRPAALYIAQPAFAQELFAHRLLHGQTPEDSRRLLEAVLTESEKIWSFNDRQARELELAIDGQLSNWVLDTSDKDAGWQYIDTSTPLFKKNGVQQLDPRLILQAAPGCLRWVLEVFFVDEVMNRYFDPRKNLIDLVANLYKEQRPDLAPLFVETINARLAGRIEALTLRDVRKYYREDRFIWSLFLNLRKLDRWIGTRVLGRRYEFILPGEIKR